MDYNDGNAQFEAIAECFDSVSLGHTYGANGESSILIDNEGYLGEGDNIIFLGEIWTSVATGPPAPYVDHADPALGTIGANNEPLTFYGYDLLNSDGSGPSFTTDPSGLSITLDTSQTSTSTTVYALYSVASTQTPNYGLIDLNTDGGTSNDVDFQLGYPDASNIVVTPSVWPAGQTTDITITGTNMGTSPTAYVNPFDITYSNQMVQADGSITATVSVPADTTDTSATVYVDPGYNGCSGGCFTSSDPNDGTGQAPPAQVTVLKAPTLSLGQALWFFGLGNTPPAAFTTGTDALGNIQTTVTASGASGGSYSWSITSGASELSFALGTQQSTATTTSNSVTVYTIGYSTSQNDVTIQLSWTPSGATTAVTSTISFSVDSPYKLVLLGSVVNTGVLADCSTTGSGGYNSEITYRILSFLGTIISNIEVNESFGLSDSAWVDDYVGNGWPVPPALSTTAPYGGEFIDQICVVNATNPTSLPPQSPSLGAVKIDHTSQEWFIGSTTEGSGIEVQTDTLQRYQDHALYTAATSPVR